MYSFEPLEDYFQRINKQQAIEEAADSFARHIDNEIMADVLAQSILKKQKVSDGYLKEKE